MNESLPPPTTSAPDSLPQPRSLWTSPQHAALVIALAFALSTFAWWTALAAFPHTQISDGQQYHKMLEAAKWTWLRYREFPGWNPYECGGLPLWDNPQAFVGAPLAWLTFAVGTTRTMEVWYVVHGALGFLSMWALLRGDLRLSRLACFVGSAMWAWNGFHQQHYGNGHSTFVPFEYFPLALFLWRRAERDIRYAVGLGMLVAWMMYEGAVYPLPHLVVLLAVESLTRAWPARRTLSMAKAGAVVLLVGFTLGASRFVPVMHQLRIHDRGLHVELDALKWDTFHDMFLVRDHARGRVPGQEYRWHEYGVYLGPFLLVVSLLGLFAVSAEHVWLLVIFVFSFALMCGHFASWSPWHLLHAHVFPFKEMRVPSRFRAEVVMTLSAFAALAIDRLPTRLRTLRSAFVQPGHLRAGLALFAVLGLGDMLGVGLTRYPQMFNGKASTRLRVSPRIYLGGKELAAFIDQPQQNRGRIKCWDEWGFEEGAALWEGDVPQVRPSDPTVATVTGSRRTPNSFTFTVDATAPAHILFNSSYDDGWHSAEGTLVRDVHLLAMDVPAGHRSVRVFYRPYGLYAGLALTGVSLLGVLAFFVSDRRGRTTRPAEAQTPRREETPLVDRADVVSPGVRTQDEGPTAMSSEVKPPDD